MTDEPPVRVIVAVDPADFAAAVAGLRAAGLEVAEELPAIGTVTGSVTADRLAGLADVPGVEAVDADRDIGLPPPASPLQ